nr:MAG: major capsid protein [Microviridae sp.]
MSLYRNANSHFAINPTINIKRSTFNRKFGIKTSFNAGLLIPLDWDEVLPGDTFSVDMSEVIRMSTPLYPIMDEIYLDTYFFFVPNRLLWKHWKEFNGENTTSKWEQETEYEVPQITAPTGGWAKGTIMDYLGIPTNKANLSVNHLPVRAYALTWNEWFRDQNLQDPAYISFEDATTAGSNGDNYVTDAIKGGKPLPVNKYHDYFTSALPEPQKGPDTLLPIGKTAPVIGDGTALGIINNINAENQQEPNVKYVMVPKLEKDNPTMDFLTTGKITGNPQLGGLEPNTNSRLGYNYAIGVTRIPEKSGLIADLQSATAININQLRQAFQIQKAFEKDARGGTRYTEIIYSHFGVTSPDSRQQRPEYLGGARVPININQVVQTSSTDSTSPQGNTAAYSLTGYKGNGFTKSFTEHGIVLTLVAIRTTHTYQQGIEKKWSRQRRFDYYWPVFANIGEQPILNKEIYAQGTAVDNEAFGYQEAWAEYRYKPNRVSGAMRSNATQSLDAWHLADNYDKLPTLGDEWIRETTANIDRTLAVQSSQEDQFFGDFYFVNKTTRAMPLYSIPGLVDHH